MGGHELIKNVTKMLRGKPLQQKIPVHEHCFIAIDDMLKHHWFRNHTREDILRVVDADERRFECWMDHRGIKFVRALYSHSDDLKKAAEHASKTAAVVQAKQVIATSAISTGPKAWPPNNAIDIGWAQGAFDGSDWSKKHPADPSFYITFQKDEQIAIIHHEDATENANGWQYGASHSGGQAGWFPGNFFGPYEPAP